jgi:hypothetical protein
LSVGDPLQASGRIAHVYQTGSDRGIPLGHYLELTTPIQVDGVEVTEVYLPGADALSLQQLVSINEPLRFGRFTDQGQAVAFVELDRLERFHRAGDPPRMLDRETLANISDVGGWRVEGHGTLEGRIDIDTRDGRAVAVLVTSARGRAQKAFALDVPVDEVRQHVGHGARVKGLIVHDGRDNRIMAPTLKAVADPPVHQFGDVVQLQGMVCHQWINDDTGTSRQTASLVLAEPILLGDRRVQQFRLDTAVSLDSGTKLRLEGTLTSYDTPSSTGARLDGVALRDVRNLQQAADMDAFAIVHDELSEDFPFQTSPRLRVRVPLEQ